MLGKPHVMIVEARFHEEIAKNLLQGATRELEKAGATFEQFPVPGALEIPAAIKMGSIRAQKPFDAYIALGCVIRGETTHYETVCNESARGLTDLMVHYDLIIGNAILTCENYNQAEARARPDKMNKGGEAVQAALALLKIRNRLGAP